jgi:hypothetical protein
MLGWNILTILFNILGHVEYNKKYQNKILYDKKVSFESKIWITCIL